MTQGTTSDAAIKALRLAARLFAAAAIVFVGLSAALALILGPSALGSGSSTPFADAVVAVSIVGFLGGLIVAFRRSLQAPGAAVALAALVALSVGQAMQGNWSLVDQGVVSLVLAVPPVLFIVTWVLSERGRQPLEGGNAREGTGPVVP